MKLYNTLTRTLEPFTPIAPPAVTMYVCGPTVYDDPHIGHARSAYIFDVLRRYLAYKKYTVKFVCNVTDVDDKIIEKAHKELEAGDLQAKCAEVAERYLDRYHETMDRLGIGRPDVEPKATEHVVPEMTDLIAKLFLQGVAYEAKDGVYFAVRRHPGYGKLSNRTLDELKAGTRVEPGEGKQDPMDFALWKAAKPDEPSWNSPWGKGRPGWHIECSAMSTKSLGDTFDIHGGGVDLVFPHHENEVAQAEAAGKKFARFWVHNGLLTVNGEKMSKSLGNYITVEQALTKAGAVDALKIFFLGSHYRSPINYSEETIEAAGKRFDGLYGFVKQAEVLGRVQRDTHSTPEEVQRLQAEFLQGMDDDLNTPVALAVLDKLADKGHQWLDEWRKRWAQCETERPGQLFPPGDDPIANTLRDHFVAAATTIRNLGAVLGLSFQIDELTDKEQQLLDEYKAARKRKDFKVSDEKRKALQEQGFIVQDTQSDSVLIRKR